MNRECRSIVHDRNRLSNRSLTHSCQQLTNERLKLIKLHQDIAVFDFAGGSSIGLSSPSSSKRVSVCRFRF